MAKDNITPQDVERGYIIPKTPDEYKTKDEIWKEEMEKEFGPQIDTDEFGDEVMYGFLGPRGQSRS